jgi:hypothetical protein
MIVSNPRNENALVDDYNSNREFSKGGRSSVLATTKPTANINSQMQSAEMAIMEEDEDEDEDDEVGTGMDNKADEEIIGIDEETGNAEIVVTEKEDNEDTGKGSKRTPSESSENPRHAPVRISMTGDIS